MARRGGPTFRPTRALQAGSGRRNMLWSAFPRGRPRARVEGGDAGDEPGRPRVGHPGRLRGRPSERQRRVRGGVPERHRVPREVVDPVVPDRRELPTVPKLRHTVFVDPSGGAQDSITLAIAHLERNIVAAGGWRGSARSGPAWAAARRTDRSGAGPVAHARGKGRGVQDPSPPRHATTADIRAPNLVPTTGSCSSWIQAARSLAPADDPGQ